MGKLIRHRKLIITVIVILLIAILAAAVFVLFGGDKKLIAPEKSYSQLTGVEVSSELAKRPILAVIIENSEAARPQTGLDRAGITFEVATEGGITRYLAFYQDNMPKEFGPIRSLRTFFLDWVMGFDASVAHVGGSPQALKLADQLKAKSLSQFKHPDAYFRINSRQSPHNVYARTSDLRGLQEQLNHGASKFDEIPRRSDQPSQTPDACNISIDFSRPNYLAEFRYQQSDNNYVRFLAGDRHLDMATGEPITVKNVIVLKIDSTPDGNKSPSVAIGSGEALIFRDGTTITARWEQKSSDERIKIIDNQGDQIPLNRGDSWFAVLPKNRSVKDSCENT